MYLLDAADDTYYAAGMRSATKTGIAVGCAIGAMYAWHAAAPDMSEAAPNGCPLVMDSMMPRRPEGSNSRIMNSLGAFALGVLSRKCMEGEADVRPDSLMRVTYSWTRMVRGMGPLPYGSIYRISVTADRNGMGAVDSVGVRWITMQEEVQSGATEHIAASVVAAKEHNGWYVSSVRPVSDYMSTGYESSTNDMDISDVAGVRGLGIGIVQDALEGDLMGNQK